MYILLQSFISQKDGGVLWLWQITVFQFHKYGQSCKLFTFKYMIKKSLTVEIFITVNEAQPSNAS